MVFGASLVCISTGSWQLLEQLAVSHVLTGQSYCFPQSSIPCVPALDQGQLRVKIRERMAGSSGEVVGAEVSVRELQELVLHPALIDYFCQESVTVICIAAVNAQMLSQISLLKKTKLICYSDVVNMGLTSFFTEPRGSASVLLKGDTSASLCLACSFLYVYYCALKQWHAYGQM